MTAAASGARGETPRSPAAAAPVAVVTGAGRGIGRELARALARRGFAVLVTDLDEAAARRAAAQIGPPAWALGLDVRDPDAHRAAAAAARERGRLDVWVNNAGVLRTCKAWEHGDEEVRLLLETDLLGVVWGSRAAVEEMRRAPGGSKHVINVASLAALAPVPGLAVYTAAKHGVLGFTAALQGDADHAGLPIAFHAACPDVVDTEMVRERSGDVDAAILWSSPRMLTPAEVAAEVVALIDGRRLVLVLPRWRGWFARAGAAAPRAMLPLAGPLRRLGAWRRRASRV